MYETRSLEIPFFSAYIIYNHALVEIVSDLKNQCKRLVNIFFVHRNAVYSFKLYYNVRNIILDMKGLTGCSLARSQGDSWQNLK